MTKKNQAQLRIFLCLLSLISIGNHCFAQEKINLKAGFGIPDLLNVGARYQVNQFQFGFYIGGYPIDGAKTITFSSDASYHFAGQSKHSERRPWFVRSGITYLRDESENYFTNELYYNLRIGREFNLSKKFGLELDFESAFLLYHEKTRKEPSSDWYDSGSDEVFRYMIGFGIFYRI